MNFNTVLATVNQIGSSLPAFKALFDQVVGLFSESEQEQLKEAYEQAKAASDAAQKQFEEARKGE